MSVNSALHSAGHMFIFITSYCAGKLSNPQNLYQIIERIHYIMYKYLKRLLVSDKSHTQMLSIKTILCHFLKHFGWSMWIIWMAILKIVAGWVWCSKLTEMVLQSPSRKFLRGVRKLMADVWRKSLSAAPNLFSQSPTLIKVLPATTRRNQKT